MLLKLFITPSYVFCIYRYHAIHKEVYDWFNISFDKFGRTSTPEQTEICQAIFKKILENNWLSENSMQQVWVIFLLIFGVILCMITFMITLFFYARKRKRRLLYSCLVVQLLDIVSGVSFLFYSFFIVVNYRL